MLNLVSIDSGASKTDILVVVDGKVELYKREEISLNIHNVNLEEVQGNIKYIMRYVSEYDVGDVVWGLAGLDTSEDYRIWKQILEGYKEYEHHILHDVEQALYAAEPNGIGILIVAGTGCNVYAHNGEVSVKIGDWGALYGDDFSGYRIGRDLINLMLHLYDGRIKDDNLLRDFLEYINIDEEFPKWVYKLDVRTTASLSKYVCNRYNNPRIKKIIDHIMYEMFLALETAIEKIGCNWKIHYTGGLFRCEYIHEQFVEEVRNRGWRLGTYIEKPVIGGVSYIMSINGYEEEVIKETILNMLRDMDKH